MVPLELLPWCEGSQGGLGHGHADDGHADESSSGGSSDILSVVAREVGAAGGWAVPRKVQALAASKVRVRSLSAGDLHSAFLSRTGQVYLCGGGPVVPPFLPMSQLLLAAEEGGQGQGEKVGSGSDSGVVSG